MTRDEAIKYLIKPVATSTEPSEEFKKQKDAYNMAIEALENECMNVQCAEMRGEDDE